MGRPRPPPRAAFIPEEVDSDGEEVQLCCQCGLPVGETAYRPEEKVPVPKRPHR